MVDLYKNGRGFPDRKHARTVLLERPTAHYRDPVPIELALDHHYEGLAVAAVDRAEGVSESGLDTHLERVSLPALMGPDGATGSGVATMVSWKYQGMGSGDTDSAPMDLGMPPGGPGRSIQMFFLDDDPMAVWDRFSVYADELASSLLGRVVFAAPFLPTIVGTDTYTDQLW